MVEYFHIGGRAGPRGLADGRLIDLVTGFEGFETGGGFKGSTDIGFLALAIGATVMDRRYSQALVHEGRFAGAGDAGQHGEAAKRDRGC